MRTRLSAGVVALGLALVASLSGSSVVGGADDGNTELASLEATCRENAADDTELAVCLDVVRSMLADDAPASLAVLDPAAESLLALGDEYDTRAVALDDARAGSGDSTLHAAVSAHYEWYTSALRSIDFPSEATPHVEAYIEAIEDAADAQRALAEDPYDASALFANYGANKAASDRQDDLYLALGLEPPSTHSQVGSGAADSPADLEGLHVGESFTWADPSDGERTTITLTEAEFHVPTDWDPGEGLTTVALHFTFRAGPDGGRTASVKAFSLDGNQHDRFTLGGEHGNSFTEHYVVRPDRMIQGWKTFAVPLEGPVEIVMTGYDEHYDERYATWILEPSPPPPPLPDEPKATPAPNPIRRVAVGSWATVRDRDGEPEAKVKVTKVRQDPYFQRTFYRNVPDNGGVWYSAFIRYESLANGFFYCPTDWQVFLGDEAYGDASYAAGAPTPELDCGTLPRGRKVGGWVTVAVPKRGEITMAYKDGGADGPPFEIVIRKK